MISRCAIPPQRGPKSGTRHRRAEPPRLAALQIDSPTLICYLTKKLLMISYPSQWPDFRFASDRSFLVTLGNEISESCHREVLRLSRLLLDHPHKGILNIHPAYASVLVTFDPMVVSPTDLEGYIRPLMENAGSLVLPEPRTVEIPVCYGGEFGPDLEDVASHNKLSADDVVRLHSSVSYQVYFLGFAPGFPYLGGMLKQIAMPRLATPRTKVPAGSVAIGGDQTGIYPLSTPGGWRIIGRSPLKLFSRDRIRPTLLEMGDHVKFVPITRDMFAQQNVG